MKQQIIWKRIDIIGQLAMLVLPQVCHFWSYPDNPILWGLFAALFTVGGWQVLSALLHAVLFPRQSWRGGRKGYNILLLTMVILAVPIAITKSEVALVGLMALLVLGPLMAVWYCFACIIELTDLVKRKEKMQSGTFSEFPSLEQNGPAK